MMIYKINVGDLVWCDNCTTAVTTVNGEEYTGNGVVCPTCQTGFYLETL